MKKFFKVQLMLAELVYCMYRFCRGVRVRQATMTYVSTLLKGEDSYHNLKISSRLKESSDGKRSR